MKEEKMLYFSPAEFAVMLDLSGEGTCSLLRSGSTPPDGEALTKAFITLFQRGLIQREKDRLVVKGAGLMFQEMWSAPFAVFLSGKPSYGGEAICYVQEDAIWLVELTDAILAREYRVRRLGRPELKDWFFDTGLLDRPVLTDVDVPELADLFADELEGSGGQLLLRLEKYVNGGRRLETYELRKGRSGRLLHCSGETDCNTEIYTAEALSRMLTDCFGKGSYDYC